MPAAAASLARGEEEEEEEEEGEEEEEERKTELPVFRNKNNINLQFIIFFPLPACP